MAKVTREAIEARLRFLHFCRAAPTKLITGKQAQQFLEQERRRKQHHISIIMERRQPNESAPEPRISRVMVDATYIERDMPIWSDDAFFLMQKNILIRLGRHKYRGHDLAMNTYTIKEALTREEFEDLWLMLEKAKRQGAYL